MIDCVLPRSLRCLAASAAPWEGRPRHATLLEPQTHPVRSMLTLCFRHLRTLSEWVCHVAPSQKSYEVSENASLCSTTRRSHKAKCSLEGHTQCHTSCASQQSGAGPQPQTNRFSDWASQINLNRRTMLFELGRHRIYKVSSQHFGTESLAQLCAIQKSLWTSQIEPRNEYVHIMKGPCKPWVAWRMIPEVNNSHRWKAEGLANHTVELIFAQKVWMPGRQSLRFAECNLKQHHSTRMQCECGWAINSDARQLAN